VRRIDPSGSRREGRSIVVLMATTFTASVALVVVVVLLAGALGGGGGANVVSVRGPLISRVDGQLVDIDTDLYQGQGRAAGTGMVLTPSGLVLTNNHVVQGSVEIQATDIGNGETYNARVIGYDEHHDVALIQLEGASGLQTVSLGDSAAVRIGTGIVTIGNAGGVGGTPSATSGTVVGLGEAITVGDEIDHTTEHLNQLIQIDGSLQPGDSGGPMIDRAGVVVGMDTAASTSFEFGPHPAGEGFALEINGVRRVAEQIRAGQPSATIHIGPTAFIGILIASGGSSVPGAEVLGTEPATPAAQSGLGPHDVIISLAGIPVRSAGGLTSALVRYHPGNRVALVWLDRDGQRHSAEITLAIGPVG
jgi:S1-C subfamily serine protease